MTYFVCFSLHRAWNHYFEQVLVKLSVYSLIKTELITAYQVLTCVWTKKNILLTPQIVSFKGFLAACYKYFNQFRKFEKVIKNMFLIFYQFKYFVTR